MTSSRPPGAPAAFPRSDAEPRKESASYGLLRLGLGLLALEAGFAALMLLAAHPPVPPRPVVRIALNKPVPAEPPRQIATRPPPAPRTPAMPRRAPPPVVLVALPVPAEPRLVAPRALLHDGRTVGLSPLLADRLSLVAATAWHETARRLPAMQDALPSSSDAWLAEIAIPPLPRQDRLTIASAAPRDWHRPLSSPLDALSAYAPAALLPESRSADPEMDFALPSEPAAPPLPDLDQLVAALDYDLDHVEVPGIFLDRLPANLAEEPESRRRKALFLRTLLPLIVQANDRSLAWRAEILAIDRARIGGGEPDDEMRTATARLLAEFRLESWDAQELMRRADIVPPSLALAQAATESGWGSSSFARDGNALFGQREFVSSPESAGRLVPRLRRFEDLGAAVAAYLRNLNTHPAYEGFRRARAALRAGGATASGKQLVSYLTRYSEQGPVYIRYISGIMRSNDLGALDQSRLRQDAVEIATGSRRTTSVE